MVSRREQRQHIQVEQRVGLLEDDQDRADSRVRDIQRRINQGVVALIMALISFISIFVTTLVNNAAGS